MDPVVTFVKKTRASVQLVLSTLSSYAKIVRVVVRERLWRMPQRELRAVADLTANAHRRVP
jgi:hypothetical protein